ncbi:MAG: hypothetical protein U0271_20820, partial [Polyangiaceae bacterium]
MRNRSFSDPATGGSRPWIGSRSTISTAFLAGVLVLAACGGAGDDGGAGGVGGDGGGGAPT